MTCARAERGRYVNECITLIGMPGSGKSTVGVVLAKMLNMDFLDVDLVIQKRTGKLLHELIDGLGREGFLDLEGQICQSIEALDTVIAPGGSAVYREDAMRHFQTLGPIVFIDIDYEDLEVRLGDLAARGVALPEGFTLRDLYEERTPLYRQWADITVKSGRHPLAQTAQQIADKVRPLL